MSVSVRVRDHSALVEAIASAAPQRQIAAAVKVSPTAINNLASGRRSTVSLSLAVRIEDYLDVDRGSLFVFSDPQVAAPYVVDSRAGAA